MQTKMAFISYIPYLNRDNETCGKVFDCGQELLDKINFKETEAAYTSANGCAWVMDGDKVGVVLFLKDAARLVKDMKTWADNQPQVFFRAIIGQVGDKYGIVIVPDLEMSLTRFRLSHQAITGNKLEIKDINLYFSAVGFVSKPGAIMYEKMKDKIGKELPIAFLDVSESEFEHSMIERAVHFATLKLEDTSYQGGYFSRYCNESHDDTAL